MIWKRILAWFWADQAPRQTLGLNEMYYISYARRKRLRQLFGVEK